jgi:hypothetical protein
MPDAPYREPGEREKVPDSERRWFTRHGESVGGPFEPAIILRSIEAGLTCVARPWLAMLTPWPRRSVRRWLGLDPPGDVGRVADVEEHFAGSGSGQTEGAA